MNKFYDNNFYYPSSAGKGIDIYFVDQGLNAHHNDFEATGRTVTCDVITGIGGHEIMTGKERYNCTGIEDYPGHGIMVASMAGGKKYGVAKNANLHMVAIDFSGGSVIKGLDYITQHAKPNKSIVSLSVGSGGYSETEGNKLKELSQMGVILISAAGNGNMNGCEPVGSDDFNSIPGYRQCIVVGGVAPKLYGDAYYRAGVSNYGDCIDIFAPIEVTNADVSKGDRNGFTTSGGTSCSAPIVAGIAATIMSEHPEIKFDHKKMKETLIEMSIKGVVHNVGSTDTANRFVNNGKRSSYSD
ncbi:subtilisin-like protein, partial [Anaeromyces robustus]